MWLINASTLMLESFHGSIPEYAILSHTWGDEEVSYREFVRASEDKDFDITNKAGYRKIKATCEETVKEGYSYAWVDTCCIDKTSSAELTEAINSMFSWYRQSKVCFVYLSDFELPEADRRARPDEFNAAFCQCRWFTRGWTLQELIAPTNVRFLNSNWEKIGTRQNLHLPIASATGVPKLLLFMPPRHNVRDYHVATRISWIAKRQTARIEDLSYSLLGILDVNMPMLYGEGAAAFTRLQEEVIRKYNDLSIFAWTDQPICKGYMNMLASSPSAFAGSSRGSYHNVRKVHVAHQLGVQFSSTNQGILFPNVSLQYQRSVPGYSHHYVLDLKYPVATFRDQKEGTYIHLRKVGPGLFVRRYESVEQQTAFRGKFYSSAFYESVCILNNLKATEKLVWQLDRWEHYAIRLRWKPWGKPGQRFWHIRTAEPRAMWDVAGNQFLLEMAAERYMHVEFIPGTFASNPDFKSFVVMIQASDAKNRDLAKIKARIVKIETWQSLNVTTLGFRGKSAVEMDSISRMQALAGGDESNTLSIAGYNVSVSVQLHQTANATPYHLVYLDWVETASTSQIDVTKGQVQPPMRNSGGEEAVVESIVLS